MLSSTLIHVAIDWDELDPVWQYVTMDHHGIWAHELKPVLNTRGSYQSSGAKLHLSKVQHVLFKRGQMDPVNLPVPEITLP